MRDSRDCVPVLRIWIGNMCRSARERIECIETIRQNERNDYRTWDWNAWKQMRVCLYLCVNKHNKQCALVRNCSLGICVCLLLRHHLVNKELLFTYGARHYLARDPHHLWPSAISSAIHSFDVKRYRSRFPPFRFVSFHVQRFSARSPFGYDVISIVIFIMIHAERYMFCSCMCRFLRVPYAFHSWAWDTNVTFVWIEMTAKNRSESIESVNRLVWCVLPLMMILLCTMFRSFSFLFGVGATFALFSLASWSLLSTLGIIIYHERNTISHHDDYLFLFCRISSPTDPLCNKMEQCAGNRVPGPTLDTLVSYDIIATECHHHHSTRKAFYIRLHQRPRAHLSRVNRQKNKPNGMCWLLTPYIIIVN